MLIQTRGQMSKMCSLLLNEVVSPLTVQRAWRTDLNLTDNRIEWDNDTMISDIIWDNQYNELNGTMIDCPLGQSWYYCISKNPDHRLIHFKYIHRAYLSPRKLNLMKLIPFPIYDRCPCGQIASFMCMYWDCSGVTRFWSMVSASLSDLLNADIPYCPGLLLFNDDSSLSLTQQQKCIL